MKFPESKICHEYLDGLIGIEIGGSAHNPFELNTINVDSIIQSEDTVHGKSQYELCGEILPVDVIADMHKLPFEDKSYDFIINSHVFEHSSNPILALKEWIRVAKKYIVLIIPHKERMYDKDNPTSTIEDIIGMQNIYKESNNCILDYHFTVWTGEFFKEFITLIPEVEIEKYVDVDDKVGNGFLVILKVK